VHQGFGEPFGLEGFEPMAAVRFASAPMIRGYLGLSSMAF
jgi:hypothetical protein